MDYQKLYHILFNAVTDSLENMAEQNFGQAAACLRQAQQTAELSVTIHEGKNRQIRRMCAACGLTVKRLRRVREHTLELGDLPAGKWRYLTQEEVKALQEG